jgi:uncharacterized protein (DUF362 family)
MANMTEFSRKDFLKALAAGLGGLYLSGCLNSDKLLPRSFSPDKITATPFSPDSPTQELVPTTEDASSTTQTAEPSPTPSLTYPHLAVARNGGEEEMVRAAVAALGGMERFVKSGDVVVVKPNVCVGYHSYEYAATTNPWVVGAIVKMAREAGAKQVKVTDFPFGGSGEQPFIASGIKAEVQKAGGKIVTVSNPRFINTAIPQGKSLKSAEIFDEVLKADVLINVPIAKHHSLALLTLAMKNLMGVIKSRSPLHANLGQNLADLSTKVKSHLVIIDAVRMLMDHGPTGGNLNDVRIANTVIASHDIVSADSYAATLFGRQPEDLTYIKKGTQMGLGIKNLSKIKIEEINLG